MSNITIYDVLRSLSDKRRIYVKHRFGLHRPADRNISKNEQELIEKLKVKSLDCYKEWEKSEEFKHITALVLQTRQAADLENIYNKVKERVSKDPHQPKDVELMLKLQKEISEHYKQAQQYFNEYDEEDEDDN